MALTCDSQSFCFSQVIARELITKQAEENAMRERSATMNRSISLEKTLENLKRDAFGTLGRTVARMHSHVTILFTDIVGFTSMSQTCLPYEGQSLPPPNTHKTT